MSDINVWYKWFGLNKNPFNTAPLNKNQIDLFDSLDSIDGSALNLMPTGNLEGQKINANLFDGIFEAQASHNIYLDESHPKEHIKFKYISSNGFLIEKLLTFYHDTYKFDAEISIKNLANYKNILHYNITLGPGLGSAFHSGAHKYEGPVTFLDGKKIKDKPRKDIFMVRHEGDVSWTAMTSNYFVAAAIAENDKAEVFIHRPEDNLKDIIKANTLTSVSFVNVTVCDKFARTPG